MSNMQKALSGIKELTGKGWDYCDALKAMATEYQVDEDELHRVCTNG